MIVHELDIVWKLIAIAKIQYPLTHRISFGMRGYQSNLNTVCLEECLWRSKLAI